MRCAACSASSWPPWSNDLASGPPGFTTGPLRDRRPEPGVATVCVQTPLPWSRSPGWPYPVRWALPGSVAEIVGRPHASTTRNLVWDQVATRDGSGRLSFYDRAHSLCPVDDHVDRAQLDHPNIAASCPRQEGHEGLIGTVGSRYGRRKTGRSRTVLETTTSPGAAHAMTCPAMWTAGPWTLGPASPHSPVCRPAGAPADLALHLKTKSFGSPTRR